VGREVKGSSGRACRPTTQPCEPNAPGIARRCNLRRRCHGHSTPTSCPSHESHEQRAVRQTFASHHCSPCCCTNDASAAPRKRSPPCWAGTRLRALLHRNLTADPKNTVPSWAPFINGQTSWEGFPEYHALLSPSPVRSSQSWGGFCVVCSQVVASCRGQSWPVGKQAEKRSPQAPSRLLPVPPTC
jgi:hypothetical protein